jgi:transposase-like protein
LPLPVSDDLLRLRQLAQSALEHFVFEESLLKLFYMALERIAKKLTMPIHGWSEALNRFAGEFGDRMLQPI